MVLSILRHTPLPVPHVQSQFERGMCLKGLKSAGKHTVLTWKLGPLCKPGVLTTENLDSS